MSPADPCKETRWPNANHGRYCKLPKPYHRYTLLGRAAKSLRWKWVRITHTHSIVCERSSANPLILKAREKNSFGKLGRNRPRKRLRLSSHWWALLQFRPLLPIGFFWFAQQKPPRQIGLGTASRVKCPATRHVFRMISTSMAVSTEQGPVESRTPCPRDTPAAAPG